MPVEPTNPDTYENGLTYKSGLVAVAIAPFFALGIAIRQLWNRSVGWPEIGMLVGSYIPIALGVTVGLHRFFTHRSFEASPVLKIVLGVLASLSLEGKITEWVATHNYHHAHSDVKGVDPHTPTEREGFAGLLWAHFGWMVFGKGARPEKYARHLMADPVVKTLDRYNVLFALASILAPALGGFKVFIWAGLLRIFFVHHITWSINSICHVFGEQQYVTGDNSRNVKWLAIFSMGESYHNNHHASPASAMHGDRWWQDVSYCAIRLLERARLVRRVKVIVPAEKKRILEDSPACVEEIAISARAS